MEGSSDFEGSADAGKVEGNLDAYCEVLLESTRRAMISQAVTSNKKRAGKLQARSLTVAHKLWQGLPS